MAIIIGTPGIDDLSTSTAGDVILGLEGDDTLAANATNVTLDGGAGDDGLFSFQGDSTLIGGPGNDFLFGSWLNDTASYASASAGVSVDLSAFAATDDGDGGFDTLLGISNVTGSAFADSLTGDDLENLLQGGGGNDMLAGGSGNDVFAYSFNLSQTTGGGSSTTYKFTDWLSEKYGVEFGDELPDCNPADHKHGKNSHQDHKHGKKDKDDKGHKDAKHDHGKGDKDHHGHKGHDKDHCGDGSGELCLSQGFFSKNYTQWLKEVVVVDLLAQGLAEDVNGNGKIDIELNQNDPTGTPFIEGLSAEELAGVFSGRDGVTLGHGKHTHERFYSNEYNSGDGGEPVVNVASDDGFDTIVDFGNGADKLQFNFTADSNWADGQSVPLAYLEGFFDVASGDYGAGGAAVDTRVSLDMDNDGNVEWSVVLADSDLNATQVFDALDIYVNGTLIG